MATNMKHILCYGDSNTWGYCAATGGRYADDMRWTRQLGQRLGDNYLVMECGLNGRTTVFDDPLCEGLNGLTHLMPAMSAHAPLDLLVIKLGTNDTKERFGATPYNIMEGLRRLVMKAQSLTDLWVDGKPRILIVAPIIIDERVYELETIGGHMGHGCAEKSRELPRFYQQLAKELDLDYMDCNPYVKPADGDFMHFDPDSNTRFARALETKVREILG